MSKTFDEVNKWFKANLLTLNLKKTYHLQFAPMNHSESDKYINFSHKKVSSTNCIKFLGLYIDDKLTWKNHMDHLITKLSLACYIMRVAKPIMSLSSLRTLYFALVHSVTTYGIIFWGNLPYSIKHFRIQKKVIRIMKGLEKKRFMQGLIPG
jgi:hypothetical protein